MSEPFYATAIYATKLDGDAWQVGVGVALVHPDPGQDAQPLGVIAAQGYFPAADGWGDHFAVVEALAPVLVDTIAAEAGLAPPSGGYVMTAIRHRIEPDIEDEP